MAIRTIVSPNTGKKSYQIDYLDPGGKRVRQTFKVKKIAVAELGKRVSLIAEGNYLKEKKSFTTTFSDLVEKYKEIFGDQKSFISAKWFFIKNLIGYFKNFF